MSGDPPRLVELSGDAFARGRAQAAGGEVRKVREVILSRVEEARAGGLLGGEAKRYLDAQRTFGERVDPLGMAELEGIAKGFGLTGDEVFTHLHLGILQDLAKLAPSSQDGCSAWAVGDGPDGPLVVKNRDFSGEHAGIQRVFRHDGPDLEQGPLLCISSLGAPGAYSSGMNAAGLAVVDTQVGVRRHRAGWLRYFLMTRILATAASVDEALRLIRWGPHAGGGTLVLADRDGAAACVELGATAVASEEAPVVCRTNHFTTTALAAETLARAESEIDANSIRRRAFLDSILPGRAWGVADAKALMARHDEAPICQHGGHDGTRTLSSTVDCCRSGVLDVCLGNPCAGQWHSIPLMS
jgi:isopenicillin-N N-acyltransferase-like protein